MHPGRILILVSIYRKLDALSYVKTLLRQLFMAIRMFLMPWT
jgi:hypothetical protein